MKKKTWVLFVCISMLLGSVLSNSQVKASSNKKIITREVFVSEINTIEDMEKLIVDYDVIVFSWTYPSGTEGMKMFNDDQNKLRRISQQLTKKSGYYSQEVLNKISNGNIVHVDFEIYKLSSNGTKVIDRSLGDTFNINFLLGSRNYGIIHNNLIVRNYVYNA